MSPQISMPKKLAGNYSLTSVVIIVFFYFI